MTACSGRLAVDGLLVLLAVWPACGSRAAEETTAAVEFFEQKVRPILVDQCYACHSAQAKKVRGDLLLDTRAGWEKGGSSGKPAVIPGDPDDSLLIQAVRHSQADLAMPPKKRLTPGQIEALESWVRMGAPDPRQGAVLRPDPHRHALGHWAFQPVREPRLPAVQDAGWVRNEVDRFILARLEAKGLRPAPRADRRTLIRRASFVLTGLAPTVDEVAAFERDRSPNAFQRVIERLLASPRYGECWGRHWLDIARYADTKGYVFEEERRYPYAYTFRDYVIRAFNDDKPYDEFLIEQIAADEVVMDGDDKSALAAMGFLTLGRRFLNNPHDIIDDRIDTLTRGTMALTVACARCHDHKYDPIPSADYYSLYGVFASSEEPQEKPLLGTIPDPIQYQSFQEELARREKELRDFLEKKESEYRERLRNTVGDYLLAAHDAAGLEDGKREELARSRKLSPLVVSRWMAALDGWRKKPEPLFAPWLAFAELPKDTFRKEAEKVTSALATDAAGQDAPAVVGVFVGNPPASLDEVANRYNRVFAESPDQSIRTFLEGHDSPISLDADQVHRLFDVPEGQRKRALQRAIDELQATHPGAPPRAMVLVDKPKPVEPVIFQRGNPNNRGEAVPRRFLALLSGPDRQPFQHGSGRLELARAIASPDNPLTARVAVNRVWLQLFGAGLVQTPSDFGTRSDPPSHPALLDWLAVRFVREGWSFKKLHRLILLSATWQESSEAVPSSAELDPDNRLLSHQNRRRLDFEAMRDTLLEAAGDLDLRMGGHAVEIADGNYARRRTIYGFVERQNLPSLFRTFDFATPDTTSSKRFTTTVPQQALFFLNSPFALDQARELARRSEIRGEDDPDGRIGRLYEILFQREPEPWEVRLGERFVRRPPEGAAEKDDGPGPWERYAQVLLMANEAIFVD